MKTTSARFKQIMASGHARNYLVTVYMTLADNTSLTLTEDDIWSGSFSIETAVSSTTSFDIGCAIIGKCKFQLNNFDERFNQYDFFNATATVWVGLEGDINEGSQTYYRMGFFTVDEPTFAGALISLELLDNMWKFDVPLEEVNLSYPVTIASAVGSVCTYCGVILGTQTFHGSSYQLAQKPEEEMNCREFLQYVAMIGCNFCVIDSTGALRIQWYDTSSILADELDGGTFSTNTTPYSDGDTADGGNFTDYTSGDSYDGGTFTDNQSVAFFTRNFSTQLGTDEIEITGVKFVIDDTAYTIGSAGYVLELENPLVNASNVNAVLNLIWDVLEGFTLRTFNISTVSNLAVEVGDCCGIMDLHGNMVYTFISNNSFGFTNHQVSMNAVSPTRSLTKRYSKTVQAAVEVARKQASEMISDYDLAVQMMNNLAINAMGAYQDYEDLATGGRIYYLSNMPITKDPQTGQCSFEVGSTVFKITGDGFFVSTDGGTTWTNGYDPNTGALVVNVLYAIGISAEWIKTGTLDVGGSGTNAVIRVKDGQNNVICTIDTNGITMNKGVLQSADYSYTSGKYADSGMIIDLVNTYMRSTAFYLNNSGGNIGAATFTNDAIKIIGEIGLYSGTGTFKFVPIDYYFAADFVLSLEAVNYTSGSATVTLVKHTNGTDTTVGTYTINSTDPVETALIDHTVGQTDGDYYQLTISGFSVSVNAHDVLLAYMGQEGFRGILQGMFKGHIESKSGTIHGNDYDTSGLYGDLAISRQNGYNNALAKIDIDTGDTNRLPDIKRTYSGGTQSVAWGDKQNFIPVDTNTPPQWQGEEGDLVFSTTNNPRILYRYENGAWVRVNFFSGSGGFAKVTIYDSGSPTAYAQYNTTIQLLDNVSNYDMLLILTSTEGDGGLSSFAIHYLVDTQEALLYTVGWQGYKERYWMADFSNDTYFTYTGNAPNETNRNPYIYKIFGIKY